MAAFMFTLIVFATAPDWKRSYNIRTINVFFLQHELSWPGLVYFFMVVITILYVIAIAESSVLELSFYGVLSLLPTVAITAVTWVLKNKVFSDDNEDNETDKQER